MSRRPLVLHLAAFTDRSDGGNPAGVVLDARGMTDAQMLGLAAELGYSESAFLTPPSDGDGVGLRYFSPLAEVAFCGHATVAAAVARASAEGTGEVVFQTMAGPVPVTTSVDASGVVSATLTSPPAGSRPADPEVVTRTLAALRWSVGDLDPSWPAQVAHAGNDHLMLGVRSRKRLADLDYDVDVLGALMTAEGWTTVNLFWREDETTFHARNPFPPGGVYEDPATGAAAAAFGGYLATVLGPADRDLTIHQGDDMGRPSVLRLRASADSDRLLVTGGAVRIPG